MLAAFTHAERQGGTPYLNLALSWPSRGQAVG